MSGGFKVRKGSEHEGRGGLTVSTKYLKLDFLLKSLHQSTIPPPHTYYCQIVVIKLRAKN